VKKGNKLSLMILSEEIRNFEHQLPLLHCEYTLVQNATTYILRSRLLQALSNERAAL